MYMLKYLSAVFPNFSLAADGETYPHIKQQTVWRREYAVRSDSAACWQPQNLPAGAQEVLKLLLLVILHPGWGKLESEFCSLFQKYDEFPERLNAVFWLTRASHLQPRCLQNILL